MRRSKRLGWTLLILAAALIAVTAVNFGINALLFRPDHRRIYKDIGVKKGEAYPTRFTETDISPDPEWGFTAEDIKNAWKKGVSELSKEGELYFLEVSFETDNYKDFDLEYDTPGRIWYICKIYVGYVEPGHQSWSGRYSTSGAFAFCMEKDEGGGWQLVTYGFP